MAPGMLLQGGTASPVAAGGGARAASSRSPRAPRVAGRPILPRGTVAVPATSQVAHAGRRGFSIHAQAKKGATEAKGAKSGAGSLSASSAEQEWHVAFPNKHHQPEDRPDKCIEHPELCSAPTDEELWQIIRLEAKEVADSEPLLSSFLYAAILSHDSFEGALAFVLANRLSDATLLATQLVRIITDVVHDEPQIVKAAFADLRATFERDPACTGYYIALLYFKGYQAVQAHRVCNALWYSDHKVMANAIHHRASTVYNADIHPGAQLGEGLLLDHGSGTVIGETAVVGRNVSIMQGVTLGGTGERGRERRHPEIGDGVLLGAAASVMGAITIGKGTMVAAGSLVVRDFLEPYQLVAGSPARVVGTANKDGSSTMDQIIPNEVHKTFCSEWERSVAAQASVAPALGKEGAAMLELARQEARAAGNGSGSLDDALGIAPSSASHAGTGSQAPAGAAPPPPTPKGVAGAAAPASAALGKAKKGVARADRGGTGKKGGHKAKAPPSAAAAGGAAAPAGAGAGKGRGGKKGKGRKAGLASVEEAEAELAFEEPEVPEGVGPLDSYDI